jgi:hypothetical protein
VGQNLIDAPSGHYVAAEKQPDGLVQVFRRQGDSGHCQKKQG